MAFRATIVAKKALNWKKNNGKPNPAEIRAEIRRLQSLLASHETLQDVSALPSVLQHGQEFGKPTTRM